MNLRIKNTSGIELEGNRLSGNTFPVKDWIKSYLGGTWDSSTKTWVVDVDKLNNLIARKANVYIDDSAPASTPKRQNWYVNTRYGRELADDF